MINWSLSPRWDKRLVGLGQDSPTSEVNLVFLHTVLSVACWLLNFFFFSFPFSFPFPFPVSVFRFFSFFLLAYFPCRQGCKTRRMSGSVELIESTINITNLAKTPGSCWSWKEAPNRRYCFLVLKRKSHITIWDVAIKITARIRLLSFDTTTLKTTLEPESRQIMNSDGTLCTVLFTKRTPNVFTPALVTLYKSHGSDQLHYNQFSGLLIESVLSSVLRCPWWDISQFVTWLCMCSVPVTFKFRISTIWSSEMTPREANFAYDTKGHLTFCWATTAAVLSTFT